MEVKDTLNLPLPLKLIAGATDVEGYRMPSPPGMSFGGFERFAGNVVEQPTFCDVPIQNDWPPRPKTNAADSMHRIRLL